MGRRSRLDEPGSLHHVTNRGLAQRSVFPTRADVRLFLSLLVRVQRLGLIDIHAYCFPQNHFHLLLGSPKGMLSEGMRRVESRFVRRFNRRRGRDGALFRGRFWSRRIDSDAYLITLLRYLDANARIAGMVDDAADYPFASARHYGRESGPIWLRRELVESIVRRASPSAEYSIEGYRRLFGPGLLDAQTDLVERRLICSGARHDPLDELIGCARSALQRWLSERAALADGRDDSLPVVSAQTIDTLVTEGRAIAPDWTVRPGRKGISGWDLLRVAVLRSACGLTYREIASRCRRDPSGLRRALRLHAVLLGDDPEYAQRATGLLEKALSRENRLEARSSRYLAE